MCLEWIQDESGVWRKAIEIMSAIFSGVLQYRILGEKVAFNSGGASAIGFQLARACAAKGMRVMRGDIDQRALDDAVVALAHPAMLLAQWSMPPTPRLP